MQRRQMFGVGEGGPEAERKGSQREQSFCGTMGAENLFGLHRAGWTLVFKDETGTAECEGVLALEFSSCHVSAVQG